MFTPNADILEGPGMYLVKSVNNPTAADKRAKRYRPRLTLMKRTTKNGIEIPLKIEFSVAKILFGNNVDELCEADFDNVVSALYKALFEMGVFVSRKNIINAPVSAFHPSKNIELTGHYTSGFVINELRKVKVHKKMDLNRDTFRNSGHSLQLYTNSHSFVVYDKIQDLKKPEKRAIDKDQNSVQLSIFDALSKRDKREILRFEVRLTKRVKMDAVLTKLNCGQSRTFRDIFRKELCQKVLQRYWDELIASDNLFLFDMESNPRNVLEAIYKNSPRIKPKQAIYLTGLRVLSREGIRDLRAIVERNANERTWSRIAGDLPTLNAISGSNYHDWVKQINKCLNDFEPFRLSTSGDLPCKAL